MEQQHYSRWARWALVVGIIITLNMFLGYSISLVYPAPSYDTFFDRSQINRVYTNQKDCVTVGGQWTAQLTESGKKGEVTGYCDSEFTARKNYDIAQKNYEKNVFLILVIAGVLVLVAGVIVSHLVLSPALAWGGILSLCIAALRYWSFAGGALKVLLLACALAGLCWVAIKKFSTPRSS